MRFNTRLEVGTLNEITIAGVNIGIARQGIACKASIRILAARSNDDIAIQRIYCDSCRTENLVTCITLQRKRSCSRV